MPVQPPSTPLANMPAAAAPAAAPPADFRLHQTTGKVEVVGELLRAPEPAATEAAAASGAALPGAMLPAALGTAGSIHSSMGSLGASDSPIEPGVGKREVSFSTQMVRRAVSFIFEEGSEGGRLSRVSSDCCSPPRLSPRPIAGAAHAH